MASDEALGYFRTSSATNVGEGRDSLSRQQEAVRGYAEFAGLRIVGEYYDAAVSGSDPVDERPGFGEMLSRIAGNGVRIVLVEDASRFARDLMVQMAGHEMLKRMGVELIAVNAPDHFREDTPTAVLVRQVLGAIAQFERAQLVRKLRSGRRRRIERTGWAGGPPAVPVEAVRAAHELRAGLEASGRRVSLRQLARELAERGFVGPSGVPYGHESVKRMLKKGYLS